MIQCCLYHVQPSASLIQIPEPWKKRPTCEEFELDPKEHDDDDDDDDKLNNNGVPVYHYIQYTITIMAMSFLFVATVILELSQMYGQKIIYNK